MESRRRVGEAMEAGLVRGVRKLTVEARDVLACGDEQAGELVGEVAALGFVGQQVAELLERFLNDGGEVDDAGHGSLPSQGQGHQDSVQRSM